VAVLRDGGAPGHDLGEAPHDLVGVTAVEEPLGRGRATFTLVESDAPSSSAEPRTTITLDEVLLGRLRLLAPVLDPVARARNATSLELLAELLGGDVDDDVRGPKAPDDRPSTT